VAYFSLAIAASCLLVGKPAAIALRIDPSPARHLYRRAPISPHGPLPATILAASLGLLSDPDLNAIGPGLLTFFTLWPALIQIVWGLITSLARYHRAQAQS